MDCNSQLPQRIAELLEAAREGFENLSVREAMELLRALEARRAELETENKNLHHSLKNLEALRDKFTDLFESAPVPLIITDETGRLMELNREGMTLLKTRGNEWRGVPLVRYIAPEDQDIFTQHLRDLKETQARLSCQLRLGHNDAEPRQVKLDSLLSHGTGQNGLKIQTIVTDIPSPTVAAQTRQTDTQVEATDALFEDRLREERRLAKLDKAESLAVLAGGIAHDFNNILMVITGNADLGLMETPKDSPMRESLEEIKRAALRAAHLSNQMRAYSGQGHAVLTRIDLNDLLERNRALLAGAVGKNGTLRFDLATDPLEIDAEALQIQQVVTNLVTNAGESLNGDAGMVTVRTGLVEATGEYLAKADLGEVIPAGPYVYLDISDTGCGIASENMEKIFDPFFTTHFTGRGLGLAVVYGVVRGHGGGIEVHSQPGAGSRFRILLPVAKRQQIAPVMEYIPTSKHKTGMVLIVDDDPAILHLTKLMLEKEDIDVVTAETGQQALDLFHLCSDDISTVLLDISMPGMSGEETFSQLRQIRKDIPIIVCSGLGDEEVLRSFAQQGCDGFLQKPFNFDILIEMIQKSGQKHQEKTVDSDKFPL